MAIEIGAKLGNMNEAWLQQEVLEEVLEFSSVPSGVWFLGGDSMIAVNKYGFRLYDEKFVYNERTRTHLTWDAVKGGILELLPVHDVRRQRHRLGRHDDASGRLRHAGLHHQGRHARSPARLQSTSASPRSKTASAISGSTRASSRRPRRRSSGSTALPKPARTSTSSAANSRSTTTSTVPATTTTWPR